MLGVPGMLESYSYPACSTQCGAEPWKANGDMKSPTHRAGTGKLEQGVWAQLRGSKCRARQQPQEEARRQPRKQGTADCMAQADAASTREESWDLGDMQGPRTASRYSPGILRATLRAGQLSLASTLGVGVSLSSPPRLWWT